MPFEINQEIESSEPDLIIPHTGGEYDKDGDPEDAIRIWIKPLNGGQGAEIMDQLISLDKKMDGRVKSGTTERTKVCRCVTKIENLVLDGKPVELFTRKTYDACPDWILGKVRAAVRDKNSEVDDLESE